MLKRCPNCDSKNLTVGCSFNFAVGYAGQDTIKNTVCLIIVHFKCTKSSTHEHDYSFRRIVDST